MMVDGAKAQHLGPDMKVLNTLANHYILKWVLAMSVKIKPQTKVRPHYHDANGKFRPGVRPDGAGRPKGSVSGRAGALQILDRVLGEVRVKKEMETALRTYILHNPVKAFRALVIPLVPKEQLVKMETETRTPVRIVFSEDED